MSVSCKECIYCKNFINDEKGEMVHIDGYLPEFWCTNPKSAKRGEFVLIFFLTYHLNKAPTHCMGGKYSLVPELLTILG